MVGHATARTRGQAARGQRGVLFSPIEKLASLWTLFELEGKERLLVTADAPFGQEDEFFEKAERVVETLVIGDGSG